MVFDHGAMAPAFSVIASSGTTSSGSIACLVPRPSHSGQAPNGLLKEKSRGSISEMVKPETGQANFSEKSRRSCVSFFDLLAEPPVTWSARSGLSASSATARPSAIFSAVSSEFGEPRGDVGAHDHAVDDDVDVVLQLLVEGRGLGDLEKLSVDLGALKALLQELGEVFSVFALAAAHDRGEQVEPRAFGERQDAVDHLGDRLALDRQAGRRRVGDADAREEQAHVVVDFRHRADGGARVARRGLLLDGDRRREPVDLVDVGLLHHLQELPGVGGERLDVAALALGVDRVEGERGFARARQPGHHDQAVARQVDVDVLEIVLARPADGDELSRVLAHGAGSFLRHATSVRGGGAAPLAAPQT